MKKKHYRRGRVSIWTYLLVIIIGVIMLYPIIWMFFATFKTNAEIFGSIKLLPETFSLQSYIDGWNVNGRITYATFFLNSFKLTLITTLLTVIACAIVAYGFARFKFPCKKILFGILITTMMLPDSILLIPKYSLYHSMNLLDSYAPFYLQAVLACYPFFVFMLIQFIRGLQKSWMNLLILMAAAN